MRESRTFGSERGSPVRGLSAYQMPSPLKGTLGCSLHGDFVVAGTWTGAKIMLEYGKMQRITSSDER